MVITCLWVWASLPSVAFAKVPSEVDATESTSEHVADEKLPDLRPDDGEALLDTESPEAAMSTQSIRISVPYAIADLTYNAQSQMGVPEGEGYVLSGDYEAVNAGDYTAQATLLDGYEWDDGSVVPKDIYWSIERKSVTVTATNANKQLGDDDPVLAATVDGVIEDDTISYSVSRQSGETVGTYAITPYGAVEQGNYSVLYVAGEFKIDETVLITESVIDSE